jgi:putative lipoic acid-binding regulatory protein
MERAFALRLRVRPGIMVVSFADGAFMTRKSMPPLELLESAHTFPGPYTFKVIGKAERGFLARTVAAVREALAHEVDPPYRIRESSGGRHLAITLEPHVESAQQVLDVYRRLGSTSGLVMLW